MRTAKPAEAPFGSWRSPISAAQVASGAVRINRVDLAPGGEVWWSEGRPSEGGRSVVVRQSASGVRADVLPSGWNARTRVHEYGGGAWAPLEAGGLVFANWEDQRLYVLQPGDRPRPLTPEPAKPQGDRYADLVVSPDGSHVVCVRERSLGTGPLVERDLVSVPLDGSLDVRSIVVDAHFVSNPRFSPDGSQMSWLAWEHPRMPWDGTELRVARVSGDGSVEPAQTLLGGSDESVFQPEWASDDSIYAVSDRSGWWNLYRVGLGGEVQALCQLEEEFGWPQWNFGMSTYKVLGDGRLLVLHGRGNFTMSLLDPRTGRLDPVAAETGTGRPRVGVGGAQGGTEGEAVFTQFTHFEPDLAAAGGVVVAVGGGPTVPLSVLRIDTTTGSVDVVRSGMDSTFDSAYLPEASSEVFEGPNGREVHAYVYEPRNPDFFAPSSELAPFVVFVHGGPTAQTSPVLNSSIAYFTSRGIGVADVDYGGSSGYGREYRNRLRGRWGIVDVEDVVAVVEGLAHQGRADPRRLLIRGGSAGGWTVLAALTRTRTFAGGASYYGVADLMGLVEDTHDFESRYIDGLVGPLPEARAVYEDRSPLAHVDELDCPILLLQGSEDKVVTPRQSEMFRDAMVRKGIAHAYICFEGEQHGFRKAENIERALEAEISFYGQVLGFEPADVPKLPLAGSRGLKT